MKITIVTTTLNAELYLRETLECIQKQYSPHIEYILVDGGSNDRTLEIAKEYKFIDIYEYPGSSMYEAINFGFEKASGDVFGWLNADDYYKGETLNYVLEKFRNNQIDILTGSMEYIDSNGDKIYPYYHHWVANKVFIDVFNELLISQPATFFTRELYHKIGGLNLQYQIVADRDFFIRAFRSGRVKTVKKELVYFRIHNDNLSTVRKNQALEENKIINNRLNAGPNTFKRRVLSFVGHFITKLFNTEMIWYKIRNQEFSIYS